MRWISNGDPPLYVWEDDQWYDQKTKTTYLAVLESRRWMNAFYFSVIDFPKKTRVMS